MSKLNVKGFTKKHAAELVRRMVAKTDKDGKVILDKDHNPVPTEAPVLEEEIMDFAVYDDRLVVVTYKGEKLSHEWTAEELKELKAAKAEKADK